MFFILFLVDLEPKNMSKKHSIRPSKPALNQTSSTSTSTNNYQNLIPIGFITLYLLLDFMPECGALDVAGPQWLYLTIINAISTLYIFYFNKQHDYEQALKKIGALSLTQIYLFLFVIAGFSIIFALNKTEALVCYTGFINTLIAFFNITILLTNRLNAFKTVAQIISIIVLVQSINTLSLFFENINHSSLDSVIYNLKGTTGNKNTLATSLVVKLSFVMYCAYTLKSWAKFIHIPILILGNSAVFIINTRSAYVGLFLQLLIMLIFSISQYLKEKNRRQILTKVAPIILSTVFAFFIAQVMLENAASLQTNKTESSSLIGRVSSIASVTQSSNARRLAFWKAGVDYIKKNPIIGAGYGNCKLVLVPYENEFQIDFNYGKHLHNDFIETTMELGILGGLAFISLFVCMLLYTYKISQSKADDSLKYIAVFSLVALAGYFTDALFNFPSERPIMQVLFAFILAVNASSFVANTDKQLSVKKTSYLTLVTVASILLLGIALYYKYFTYKSLVTQNSIAQDNFPNSGTHKAVDINPQLPEIPNLAVVANSPVDVIKAWYLSKDGKYDEAMILLNRSTKVNPYNMANEFVKAQVFYQTNRLDSALYYAKKGFDTRPSNVGFYGLLMDISKAKKDTATIKNVFKRCIKHRNDEPNVWNKYIEVLLNLNYNQDSLLNIAGAAKKVFPENKIIRKNPFMINAIFASQKNNYNGLLTNSLKIVEIDPVDYVYLENVGACYFMLRQFNLAMPYLDRVITAKAFNNGKSEYIKGLCLINLGKKEDACYYLQIANSKGFMDSNEKVSMHCR